jgi:hypothetical protein
MPKSAIIQEAAEEAIQTWQTQRTTSLKAAATKLYFPTVRDRLRIQINLTPKLTAVLSGHGKTSFKQSKNNSSWSVWPWRIAPIGYPKTRATTANTFPSHLSYSLTILHWTPLRSTAVTDIDERIKVHRRHHDLDHSGNLNYHHKRNVSRLQTFPPFRHVTPFEITTEFRKRKRSYYLIGKRFWRLFFLPCDRPFIHSVLCRSLFKIAVSYI